MWWSRLETLSICSPIPVQLCSPVPYSSTLDDLHSTNQFLNMACHCQRFRNMYIQMLCLCTHGIVAFCLYCIILSDKIYDFTLVHIIFILSHIYSFHWSYCLPLLQVYVTILNKYQYYLAVRISIYLIWLHPFSYGAYFLSIKPAINPLDLILQIGLSEIQFKHPLHFL